MTINVEWDRAASNGREWFTADGGPAARDKTEYVALLSPTILLVMVGVSPRKGRRT